MKYPTTITATQLIELGIPEHIIKALPRAGIYFPPYGKKPEPMYLTALARFKASSVDSRPERSSDARANGSHLRCKRVKRLV